MNWNNGVRATHGSNFPANRVDSRGGSRMCRPVCSRSCNNSCIWACSRSKRTAYNTNSRPNVRNQPNLYGVPGSYGAPTSRGVPIRPLLPSRTVLSPLRPSLKRNRETFDDSSAQIPQRRRQTCRIARRKSLTKKLLASRPDVPSHALRHVGMLRHGKVSRWTCSYHGRTADWRGTAQSAREPVYQS